MYRRVPGRSEGRLATVRAGLPHRARGGRLRRSTSRIRPAAGHSGAVLRPARPPTRSTRRSWRSCWQRTICRRFGWRMSRRRRCVVRSLGVRTSSVSAPGSRTRCSQSFTATWCPSRRWLTCSGSRAAVGWPTSRSRLMSSSRSGRCCASSTSTPRSCGSSTRRSGVHRVASLLKRWLLGTHRGKVSPEHLDAYLNEFTFRFNRRRSRRRGFSSSDCPSRPTRSPTWHMLQTGERYNDLGGDYFTSRHPDRQIKCLIAQLERLGQVTLRPTPA